MPKCYYAPCKEFDECNRLIEVYYHTGQYEACFAGHLALAEQGYPLAECQVGYFYYEGLGVERDLDLAFYWTKRAAEHGDRDAQYNMGDYFYEAGATVEKDLARAGEWYLLAARQGQPEAQEKCRCLGIPWETD